MISTLTTEVVGICTMGNTSCSRTPSLFDVQASGQPVVGLNKEKCDCYSFTKEGMCHGDQHGQTFPPLMLYFLSSSGGPALEPHYRL